MEFLVDNRGHFLQTSKRKQGSSFSIRLGPADTTPTRWPKVRLSWRVANSVHGLIAPMHRSCAVRQHDAA